jgi:hypothetical protein
VTSYEWREYKGYWGSEIPDESSNTEGTENEAQSARRLKPPVTFPWPQAEQPTVQLAPLRPASPVRAQQPELEELPAFEQSAALRVSPRR